MIDLCWGSVEENIYTMCNEIVLSGHSYSGIYGIPTGGSFIALLVRNLLIKYYRLPLPLLDNPRLHCLVVDDIIDSGRTIKSYVEQGYDCASPYTKGLVDIKLVNNPLCIKEWVKFPWEHTIKPTDAMTRLLEWCGCSVEDDEYVDTMLERTRSFIMNAG